MIVSNALGVRLTGNKSTDKTYFHHSGFMDGLKEVPITRMRNRRPEEVSFAGQDVMRQATPSLRLSCHFLWPTAHLSSRSPHFYPHLLTPDHPPRRFWNVAQEHVPRPPS